MNRTVDLGRTGFKQQNDSVSKTTIFMNWLRIVTAIPSSFRLRTSVLNFSPLPRAVNQAKPCWYFPHAAQCLSFVIALTIPWIQVFGLCHILHGFSLYSEASS